MEFSVEAAVICTGISFTTVFLLVPVFCAIARSLSFLDVPDGKIKQHAQPIPPVGGLAIYAGFMAGIIFFVPYTPEIISMVVGLTLLLVVGCADDIICLAPRQKFLGQLIATCFLIYTAFSLKTSFTDNILYAPFAVWWIVSITNAFNLIDIMDGLASTVGCMAAFGFLSISFFTQATYLVLMLCSCIGALLAFLWYNKPQATVYLGDAGALLIGGFLSLVPFFIEWRSFTFFGFLAPVIILAIPALEIVSLIVIRLYRSLPIYHASPDHFALYLQHNGWKRKNILLFIASMALLCNTVAYCLFCDKISLPTVFFMAALFLIVWIRVVFAHLLRNIAWSTEQ